MVAIWLQNKTLFSFSEFQSFCYRGRLETHLKVLQVFAALFSEPVTLPMDFSGYYCKSKKPKHQNPQTNCNLTPLSTPVVGVRLSIFKETMVCLSLFWLTDSSIALNHSYCSTKVHIYFQSCSWYSCFEYLGRLVTCRFSLAHFGCSHLPCSLVSSVLWCFHLSQHSCVLLCFQWSPQVVVHRALLVYGFFCGGEQPSPSSLHVCLESEWMEQAILAGGGKKG